MNYIKFSLFLFLISFSLLVAKEGIYYSFQEIPAGNFFVHTLEIDPDLYEIKPVKALDDGIGRESVFSLAKRYDAVAAINGGFFSIGTLLDGKACGALKIKDWYAIPSKPRGCIGWSSNKKLVLFDRLLVLLKALNASTSFLLDGLNTSRNQGEVILFTPAFHRTTLTYPDGEEILVKNGKVSEIRRYLGSSILREDVLVLSIQKDHPLFGSFQIEAPLSFSFQILPQEEFTSAKDWEDCDYILGGTPLLIYNNQKLTDFSSEKTKETFITNRHARTAVGILPNGHWLFVVVDKTTTSDGMTMKELTDLMSFLGCAYALNLDGGGSSTLVYDGEIKNSPYGDEDEGDGEKAVRRVSDAIVITIR